MTETNEGNDVGEAQPTEASLPTEAQSSSDVIAPAETDEEKARRFDADLALQSELNDAQLKQIEEEQKLHPLLGDKIPFDVLIMEYDVDKSPGFHIKAKELAEIYSDIRQVRRDGNCFYRAVLAAEIELIFKDPEEMARFETVCKGWQKRLIDLGFADFTTSDFCEYFYEFLGTIKNKTKTQKEIFNDLADDNHANYLMLFLRLIASGYLREHAAEYEPFIDSDKGLVEYCQSEIEAMWKDADHLAITGLVHAIGRAIRVEYMDQSAAPNGGVHYDFPPDSEETPKICLLYRPGHYDLIYRR